MSGIFLCARAGDSPQTTGRIHDHIVATFGPAALVDGATATPPGVEIRAALDGVMNQQSVALVVIGPRWLDATSPGGKRSLDDPFDTARLQIEAALRWQIPLIPLLVEGAAMPPDASLPPSIAGLAGYPSMPVRNDPYFAADMETVATTLARWVPRLPVAQVGQSDRLVRRYGIVVGVLLIVLGIAALLLSALANSQKTQADQTLEQGIISAFVLLTLLGYFLAGFYAARRTGLVRSGRGAGVIAGLVNGLSVFLLAAFIVIGGLLTPASSSSDSLQQAFGKIVGLIIVVFAALIGIAWLVAQVLVGLGLGALGGLFGRRSARKRAQGQPAPMTAAAVPRQR
jgi:hypothetical protein